MVLISCFAVAFRTGTGGGLGGAGAGLGGGLGGTGAGVSTGSLYPPFLLMVLKYSLVDSALKSILLGGIPLSRLNSVFHSSVVSMIFLYFSISAARPAPINPADSSALIPAMVWSWVTLTSFAEARSSIHT